MGKTNNKEQRVHKIVHSGQYQGVNYWIVKNGIEANEQTYLWYCAYVEPPKEKIESLDKDELEVHGGITFDGFLSLIEERIVWGWDYNHSEDFDWDSGCIKTIFQSKEEKEVIEIISNDCREFIGRYLV